MFESIVVYTLFCARIFAYSVSLYGFRHHSAMFFVA